MAEIASIDVASYVEGKDPRRCTKVAILDGTNFLPDTEGPRAAYADALYFTTRFCGGMESYVSELRCNDTVFYGTPLGVFYLDDVSRRMFPLFLVDATDKTWPWSVAYVGKKFYFSQFDVGLWEYTPANGDVRQVLTPVFDAIRFVTSSYGRLVALSTNYVLWSAIDDGSDLSPTVATGAGAQGISKIGGTPYRVDPVADGVLVATSNGLMKGLKVDETYVYEWRVISADLRLTSPSSGVDIPDVGIIYFDRHGLHLFTLDGTLSPWEVEMSNSFLRLYLKNTRVLESGNVMLHYSYAENCVYIGFSLSGGKGVYTRIFVYCIATGKWGVFNRTLYGIVDIPDEHNEWRAAYLDVYGFLRRFTDTPYREITASPADIVMHAYYKDFGGAAWRTLTDTVNERITNATTGVQDLNLRQDIRFHFLDWHGMRDCSTAAYMSTVKSGLYQKTWVYVKTVEKLNFEQFTCTWDTGLLRGLPIVDTAIEEESTIGGGLITGATLSEGNSLYTTPPYNNFYTATDFAGPLEDGFHILVLKNYSLDHADLGSKITLGPFRIASNTQTAERCAINSIMLGTTDLGGLEIRVDYNESMDPDIDRNTSPEPDLDFGIGFTSQNIFSAEYAMTTDARADSNFTQTLYPVRQDQYGIHYRPQPIVGIYGLLTLYTKSAGDYFNIPLIDVSGTTYGVSL